GIADIIGGVTGVTPWVTSLRCGRALHDGYARWAGDVEEGGVQRAFFSSAELTLNPPPSLLPLPLFTVLAPLPPTVFGGLNLRPRDRRGRRKGKRLSSSINHQMATPPAGVWLSWLSFLASAALNYGGAAFLPGPTARRQSAPRSHTMTMLRSSAEDGSGRETTRAKGKRIVLIRHGCTYMNEYLSQKGCRWGDAGFTDQFEEPERTEMYQDSRLSPLGVWQAGELRERLRDDPIVHEIDLVVCSPLTRALKTMDIALYPFLGIGNGKEGGGSPGPPILALPEASERVYLISDIGRTSAVLKQEFPYVDFDMCRAVRSPSCEGAEDDEAWWWQPSSSLSSYVEWRPSDAGQSYACPGEPQFDFERRMKGLYSFLHSREEQTIALVCHWGVVDWLIGKDFDNCEMRVLDFEADFRPKGFAMSDEDAAELFSEGERSASSANAD
ncbi:hypothetical protein THAOC_25554, partial [Thalassiosira oceanica]